MKTTRIHETVLVVAVGHSCIGCMAWESPFIVFRRNDGQQLLWHSDNVESICDRFGFPDFRYMRERFVVLNASIRGNGKVQRVHDICDL